MSDRMSEQPIRRAATTIAVRRSADGPEVLVVERGAASRFLPGYVAFPGGAVDPADGDLAMRWFGDAGAATRAAAVRELIEETSVAVTGSGARSVTIGDPLAVVDADPPDARALHGIARWVAPEDVPVRFDAQYFAVEVADDVDPVPDGGETAAAWWTSPRLLLDEWRDGARRLYWPTWLTVVELAACADVDQLLALRIETREPDDDEVASMPASVFWQDR
jgi:8-oxo-dGTP pyrophosphatase MutT (NUDIX family)